MASKKTTEALEAKLALLKNDHAELTRQRDKLGKEIQGWPIEVIHGRQFRRVVNEQVDRAYDDSHRALQHMEHEISELEAWLHPPKGREKERVYQQAQQDRVANPQLTIRLLAEKYLPHFFPDRADSAIRMMDQGLRRLTRKSAKPTKTDTD